MRRGRARHGQPLRNPARPRARPPHRRLRSEGGLSARSWATGRCCGATHGPTPATYVGIAEKLVRRVPRLRQRGPWRASPRARPRAPARARAQEPRHQAPRGTPAPRQPHLTLRTKHRVRHEPDAQRRTRSLVRCVAPELVRSARAGDARDGREWPWAPRRTRSTRLNRAGGSTTWFGPPMLEPVAARTPLSAAGPGVLGPRGDIGALRTCRRARPPQSRRPRSVAGAAPGQALKAVCGVTSV